MTRMDGVRNVDVRKWTGVDSNIVVENTKTTRFSRYGHKKERKIYDGQEKYGNEQY